MTSLYPYQERVSEALRAGRNVIVQAPTGAGKTLAALYPYFENLECYAEDAYPAQAPLPLTCRYAVPMRVLAAQFEREYRNWFARLDKMRATNLRRRYAEKLELKLPAIQTGESPQDPKFESLLTFCTIDQLLAGFIGTPYSLGLGQANLNVAAAIGSYLVLDEFHLYPLGTSGGARLTTLAMLRLLSGLCRFTLMTATFSTTLLDKLAALLGAEVVRVEDREELASIMQGRQRVIHRADGPMTSEAIWAAHQAARERGAGASLVVCNTVSRAQDVYARLCDLLARESGAGDVRIELLHSRFIPEHRQQKSERLEAWLGEQQWCDGCYVGPDTIVVATQVVEVGLNISAGVLHTEIAPASSIIQRAGRCARFEKQFGDVTVYPILPRDNGNISYRPYDQPICAATWDALPTAATPFGFTEEQLLIDMVHAEEDTAFLGRFQQSETQVKEFIKDTLTSHDPEHRSKLIRSVASATVLIHPTPEGSITIRPFDWEAFSLHPSTFEGAWDSLQQRAQALELPWVMKELIPGGDLRQEPDNDRESPYTWQAVSSKYQIARALRLALPPQLAAYDEYLGFRLLLNDQDQPGTWQSSPMNKQQLKRGFAKRTQRSYVEHISGLLAAYNWSVRRELAWVAMRLESTLNAPAGSVDLATRLAIACHDIGKLGDGWQHWAHATQEALVERYGAQYAVQPGREFLAKTDGLDFWQDEAAIQGDLRQHGITRPPHACAGVVAGAECIATRLLEGTQVAQQEAVSALTRATLTSIAHHHAPTAVTYDAISWHEGPVLDVIAQALTTCRVETTALATVSRSLASKLAGQLPATYLVEPAFGTRQSCLSTWLAFVLVRMLRLCDQRAERDW